MQVAKKKNKPEEKHRETTVEFLASLAAVLVTGLFIITFVVQAFEIPSSSMENTLLIGDHVFVNRVQFAPRTNWVGPLLPYGQTHHGDIVVFLSPAQPGLYIVKPPNQYQHTAVSERLGFLAHVVIHFFDETRWRRTLRMVR